MKIFTIVIFLLFLAYYSWNQSKNKSDEMPEISSIEGMKFMSNSNYIFLDVRTTAEHKAVSIPNTPVIPVQELASRLNEIQKLKKKKIIVYCRSGNRSRKGTAILINAGFDAVNLIGGMNQWQGPVEKR